MVLSYLKRAREKKTEKNLAHVFFKNNIENDEYFRGLYFTICSKISLFSYDENRGTFEEIQYNSDNELCYSFCYPDRLGAIRSMKIVKLLRIHDVYEIRLFDSFHQIRILFVVNSLRYDRVLTFGFDKQHGVDLTDVLRDESYLINREEINLENYNYWIGGEVL
ncbi:hypothetical protein [Liquorilactobacillus ghanensis]|uniref:hypothetical protein n=1 Tax=Liquorilactobacillus ghanensis TaxID=399370 RepID=UPI0039EBF024